MFCCSKPTGIAIQETIGQSNMTEKELKHICLSNTTSTGISDLPVASLGASSEKETFFSTRELVSWDISPEHYQRFLGNLNVLQKPGNSRTLQSAPLSTSTTGKAERIPKQGSLKGHSLNLSIGDRKSQPPD